MKEVFYCNSDCENYECEMHLRNTGLILEANKDMDVRPEIMMNDFSIKGCEQYKRPLPR